VKKINEYATLVMGAVLMSLSMIIVALNAQLLKTYFK
jgi:cation transport ATPase